MRNIFRFLIGFGLILTISTISARTFALDERSLDWPLKIDVARIMLGNSLNGYEGNDTQGYIHGGCDLAVPVGTEIITPVSGLVEVSFYRVQSSPASGHVTTERFPFVKSPENFSKYRLTTEVAITTKDGTRLEFHHVDPSSIPDAIISPTGSPVSVRKDDVVGAVVQWPIAMLGNDYSHVHYNIYESGTKIPLNCIYYSQLPLSDHKVPKINKVFLQYKDRVEEWKAGDVVQKPLEILLDTSDQTDLSPFFQPPPLVGLIVDGVKVEWDFRRRLSAADGNLPELNDLFAFDVKVGAALYSTVVDYWQMKTIIRLRVPKTGPFTIYAEDNYGNRAELNGRFL